MQRMSTGERSRRITRALLRSISFPQGLAVFAPGENEQGESAGIASPALGPNMTCRATSTTTAGKGCMARVAEAGGAPAVGRIGKVEGVAMQPEIAVWKLAKKGGAKRRMGGRKALPQVVSSASQMPLSAPSPAGYSEIVYKSSGVAKQFPLLLALEAPSTRQREEASSVVMGMVGKVLVGKNERGKGPCSTEREGHKLVRMDTLHVSIGGAKERKLRLGICRSKGDFAEAIMPTGKGLVDMEAKVRNGMCRKSRKRGRGGGMKEGISRKLDKGGKRKVEEESTTTNPTRILRRIKHQLQRIRKEEFFLEVYHADGWKGSSKEKVRPVVELNRAQKQVLQSKLAIRESMRELDLLTQQGALNDRAFDNEGQITHEQIFCARCQFKGIAPDNDIILCDGYCNRAFHQQCLHPPLKTADIPPGDEGWLCPECDCKLECIYAIQSDIGTPLGPSTTWEDIFPEVVEARLQDSGQGKRQLADVNAEVEWPSDESDDEDYNPLKKEGPSKANAHKGDHVELTEADEEDDGPDKESDSSAEGKDSWEESSDDEELNEEVLERLKTEGRRRVRECLVSGKSAGDNGGKQRLLDGMAGIVGGECVVDLTMDEEELPVSGKRQRKPVDYCKLHDELFGVKGDEGKDMEEAGSDDEDWGPGLAKRHKRTSVRVHPHGSAPCRSKPRRSKSGTIGVCEAKAPASMTGDLLPGIENLRRSGPGSRLPEAAKEVLRNAYVKAKGVPKKMERDELAVLTGLGARQVDTWYRNFQHKHKDQAAQLIAQVSEQTAKPPHKHSPSGHKSSVAAMVLQGTSENGLESGYDRQRRKRSSRGGEAKVGLPTAPSEEVYGNAYDPKFASRASVRLRGQDVRMAVPIPQIKLLPRRARTGKAVTPPPATSMVPMGVVVVHGTPGGQPLNGVEPVQALLGAVRSRLQQLKSTLR